MKTFSGREIKASIKSSESIKIRGRNVNIYNAVRKCDFIDKVRVRQYGGTSTILVSQEVVDAIKAYAQSDGYADLKLSEYLARMFGGQ